MAIQLEAVKLGLDVYRPIAEGGRCDLILGFGYELLRVQCKWVESPEGRADCFLHQFTTYRGGLSTPDVLRGGC